MRACVLDISTRVLRFEMSRVLPVSVQSKLQQLYFSGFCRPDEVNVDCLEYLAGIDESNALLAIHELSTVERSKIKNVSAFFIGIMRKRFALNVSRSAVNASSASLVDEGIPLQLYYFDPAQEYIPKMPLGFREDGFDPYVLEKLEQLVRRGIIVIAELDPRVLNELKSLSRQSALATLTEFGVSDKTKIKSVSGYLTGMMKRLGQPRRSESLATVASSLPLQAAIPINANKRPRTDICAPWEGNGKSRQLVDYAIERKVAQGQLKLGDVDEATREFLGGLEEQMAMQALEDFSQKDATTINNKLAFMKGVVRKIIEREAQRFHSL